MLFTFIFYISIFPYILFPLVFAETVPSNTETVRQTILFFANAHIAVTLLFYLDKQFKPIIQDNRTRYIHAPIAAVILAGLTYAVVPESLAVGWWCIYMFWQNWHFGRQNYGIYAMVALEEQGSAKVNAFEKYLIYSAVFLGSLGGMFFAGGTGQIHDLLMLIRGYCGYLTLGLALIGIFYVLANSSRFSSNRILFLLFSLLFFTPQFLFDSAQLGFNIYSISHSFQYLFFMTALTFNKNDPGKEGEALIVNQAFLNSLVFLGIILIGGAVITIRGEFGDLVGNLTSLDFLGKFVTGSMFGLVIAHFIVDAHAWRLRDAPQREYVLNRFSFLRSPKVEY